MIDTQASIYTKVKASVVCGLANMIALYDFTLFAVLLPIIHQHFFMEDGNTSSLLIGYMGFAVSFLIAPFASIFWGYIGDKYGKGSLMRYSLLIMSIPSLVITLIPTYQEIGVFATITLISMRILQGISASAEVLGSKLYAFEISGEKFQGMASAIISGLGAFGVMIAMLMGMVISKSHDEQSWRTAFLIGSILFFLMFAFRYIKPSKPQTKSSSISLGSIISVLKSNTSDTMYAFVLSAVLGVLSYFLHSFMILFLIQQSKDPEYAYFIASQNLFITGCTAILTGIITSNFRINNALIMKIICSICAFTFIPAFYLIKIGAVDAVHIMLFYALMLGAFAAISSVEVVRSFTYEARCRGALFVNAFGVSFFGGLTPLTLMYVSSIDILYTGIVLTIFFISATSLIARRP
ncbi:MAG: MFS transporter [Alphaproteobacteria bacterium]|jgi:MHS family proline/betaine transporter-like MFS transporter|nr:MFS transporter [Candidatus Jidaibacter sp.]